MNKTIIFFTKKYPFDWGEEFIEDEMPMLANRFSKVVIVATAISKKSVQTRFVPENVSVFGIHDVQNKYLRYAKYISCGFFKIIKRDVLAEIKKAKGIKAKLGVLYIEARVNHTLRQLKKNEVFYQTHLKQASVLYSYWFSDLPVLLYQLKKQCCAPGVVTVSRAHRYDLYADRNITGFVPFREQVMEKIDMVFPCSEDGTRYLKKLYPQSVNKIKTAYLGTYGFNVMSGHGKGKYHIVTCSAISPIKRVRLLAEALELLENSHGIKNVCWTCIGDGPLLNDLRAYASGCIHSIQVEFKGRMNNADVLDYYKGNDVDLFVNVSANEGLPVSIMEAQSFGIPTIATDVGGTREIVLDGLTGKLLPKDLDATVLADAIEEMMNRTVDRNAIQKFWDDHFNAKTNYACFANELIQTIVAKQKIEEQG